MRGARAPQCRGGLECEVPRALKGLQAPGLEGGSELERVRAFESWVVVFVVSGIDTCRGVSSIVLAVVMFLILGCPDSDPSSCSSSIYCCPMIMMVMMMMIIIINVITRRPYCCCSFT